MNHKLFKLMFGQLQEIAVHKKAHLIPLITVTVTKDFIVPTQMKMPTAYIKKT